jgi:hypothetical protein
VLRDLGKRKPGWLHDAAQAMATATEQDWKAFRSAGEGLAQSAAGTSRNHAWKPIAIVLAITLLVVLVLAALWLPADGPRMSRCFEREPR